MSKNLRGQWTVSKLTYLLSLSSSWEGGHYGWMKKLIASWMTTGNARRYKESTQETGQLNRMKQSSLGTVGFSSWLCQFHLYYFPPTIPQFTIRVINSTKVVQKGGKKIKIRLTFFRLELFFEIAIFTHSVVCSIVPKLFYFPPLWLVVKFFWLNPLVDDLPTTHLVPTSQIWK